MFKGTWSTQQDSWKQTQGLRLRLAVRHHGSGGSFAEWAGDVTRMHTYTMFVLVFSKCACFDVGWGKGSSMLVLMLFQWSYI